MSTFFLINNKTGELLNEMYGDYDEMLCEWYEMIIYDNDIEIIEIMGECK